MPLLTRLLKENADQGAGIGWKAIAPSSSCWAIHMRNQGQRCWPSFWLSYGWVISTSISLADMVWAKNAGEGV